MSVHTMFRPNNPIEGALLWAWDLIDISENMGRVQDWIETISNGLTSLIHFIVFAFLAAGGAALAYHFDIRSTLNGMQAVRDVVIPSMPVKVEQITYLVILALTLMPMFLELFTAGLAKYNVKIVQIAIIGFTIFDMVTDIPGAYEQAMKMWPQIETMGWGLSFIVYWSYFLGWLFFATIGFELATAIFGYAAIIFFFKVFYGQGSFNMHYGGVSRGPARKRKSSVSSVDIEEPIIIEA